jgi:hypothetical protein
MDGSYPEGRRSGADGQGELADRAVVATVVMVMRHAGRLRAILVMVDMSRLYGIKEYPQRRKEPYHYFIFIPDIFSHKTLHLIDSGCFCFCGNKDNKGRKISACLSFFIVLSGTMRFSPPFYIYRYDNPVSICKPKH